MKKLIWILLVSCFVFSHAGELVVNGSFETVEDKFAAKWNPHCFMEGEGIIELDSQNPASGKNAIRLTNTNQKGVVACDQLIRLPNTLTSDRKLEVSVKVCADNAQGGELVVMSRDENRNQTQWISTLTFSGSYEYRKFSKSVNIKAGTKYVTISCRAPRAKGTIWVDDVSAVMEEEEIAGVDVELVVNPELSGDLSAVTGLPKGWTKKMFEGREAMGDVKMAAAGFESKEAVSLQYISGAQVFGAEAELNPFVPGASEYTAGAMVLCAKNGSAKMMAEFFDAAGRVAGSAESEELASESWKALTWKFSTPPECAKIKLYCLSASTGAVTFDRVTCRRTGKAVAAGIEFVAKPLPVEASKIWNDGKPVFNSFAEAPLPLGFHFKGNKNRLKNPALELDIPVGVHIADAFSSHLGAYGYEDPIVTPLKRPEGDYLRCRFEKIRSFRIMQMDFAWERKLIVVLAPDEPKSAIGKTCKVFFRVADGSVRGTEESFDLNFLPMPEGPQPDNFRIYRWDQDDSIYSKNDVFLEYAKVLEAAGMTMFNRRGSERTRELGKLLEPRGGWLFRGYIPNYIHEKGRKEYKTMNVQYSVNANGQLEQGSLCPLYAAMDPAFRKFTKEDISRYLDILQVKDGEMVTMDTEPWHPLDTCFCEHCLAAFKERMKLDHLPTDVEIRKNYPQDWAYFRVDLQAAPIRLWSESIKAARPNAIVGDYDYVFDYGSPNADSRFQSCAKSAKLNEQWLDMHITSYYHLIDKQAFDQIRLGTRNLNKTYVPICAIDGVGYLSASEVLKPAQARQTMVAGAAHGCPEFAIYSGRHLDGAHIAALARGRHEIAVMQRFYRKGGKAENDAQGVTLEPKPFQTRRITVEGNERILRFPNWNDKYAMAATEDGNDIGVTIFNYHREQTLFAELKLTVPAGNYVVVNPVTGQCLEVPEPGRVSWTAAELANGVLVSIGPLDIGYVIVKPATQADANLRFERTAQEMEAEFQKAKAAFGGVGDFKDRRVGKFAVSQTDSNGDGVPEILLETPTMTLILDSAQGVAENWKVNGVDLGGRFFIDQIWLPITAKGPLQGKAKGIPVADVTENGVRLSFMLELKALPLTMTKTFIATADSLTVEWRYETVGEATSKASFWTKNLTVGEPKLLLPDFPEECLVLSVGEGIPDGFSAKELKRAATPVSTTVWNGVTMIATPEDGSAPMNYYAWQSPSIKTWEWMSPILTVEPGKPLVRRVTFTVK
ncbi:MAG: hypothetical protein J6X55_16145 [Victivallales bacterium]|nr:hypothetical protein [Victivallales bacterium]